MNKLFKKTSSSYIFFSLVSAVVFIFLVIAETTLSHRNNQYFQTLSDWTVTKNGETLPDHIPGVSFLEGAAKKGDVFILSGTIPKNDTAYPVLWIYTQDASIAVKSGNKMLYVAGIDDLLHGRMLGTGYHQIPLDYLSDNGDIKIVITAGENNLMHTLPAVYMTSAIACFSNFIKSKIITFTSALFLIFLGTIGTIICTLTYFTKKNYFQMIAASLFTLSIGLYVFTSNSFLQIISTNFVLNSWIKYINLYLAPIFLVLTLGIKSPITKNVRTTAKLFLVIYTCYIFTALLLQIFTNIHFAVTIIAWNLIVSMSIICAMVECIYYIMKDKETFQIVQFGYIVMVLFYYLNFIHIYKFSTFSNPQEMICNSFLCAGVLIFVLSAVFKYLITLSEFVAEQSRSDASEKILNHDPISSLSTRKRALEVLQEFKDSHMEYSVVSLSLQNFDDFIKTGGRDSGDKAIARYAKIIKRVFASYGICGRVSESRFIVISPELPETKLKSLVKVFEKLVQKENSRNKTMQLESLAGYGYSREALDSDPLLVCEIADKERYFPSPDKVFKLDAVWNEAPALENDETKEISQDE